MKRLLPSIIFAFALHAILLSTDFSWLEFTSGPTMASKSLSIILSADKLQKHKTQAAVSEKTFEKRLDPTLNQKLSKKPAGKPAPVPVENTTQRRQLLPAAPPENSAKKSRPKTSLKALTRNKQIIKTSEIVRPVSIAQQHVPPEVRAEISSPFSFGNRPSPLLVPAETTDIKKTHRGPDGSLEPSTTAAVQPATQIEDTLSGAVLKIARPLYKQNTSPPYPRKARRLGYEGIVMLKVLVDESGRVDNLTVLKSSGYSILDRTALSSVKKWLFEPGTEGGIKKKMWVKIPIRFQLE